MASYRIDSSNPPPEFFEARNLAGATLEQQFNLLPQSGSPSRNAKWLKADLTWPSFDHLTFAYRDAVFSVLVDIVESNASSLESKATKRCLDAAVAHNLIPCVFQVDRRTMQPSSGGWNLFDLRDGRPVDPAQTPDTGTVPMSAWELQSFSVQVVRGHVTGKLGGKEHSFCDVLGIDPQIWFEDSKGNNGWVVVRNFPLARILLVACTVRRPLSLPQIRNETSRAWTYDMHITKQQHMKRRDKAAANMHTT